MNYLVLFGVVLITLVNDHYLKYTYSGFITGKISDFAGLFFAPIFFVWLIYFVKNKFQIPTLIKKKHFLISLFLTGSCFLLFKLPIGLGHFFADFFSSAFFRIKIVEDPTDLVALISLYFSFLFMKKNLTN